VALMRWFLIVATGLVALASPSRAAQGRVIKVLPLYLDTNGQYTVSPSLYDRDAYQFFLQLHPSKRTGLRFLVNWTTLKTGSDPLKLQVEMRGVAEGKLPKQRVLEETVRRHGWFTQWTGLTLGGAEYKDFGEVTAWRARLWDGDKLLGEQQSFLW
jgi:hypothetical protein